jgi:hypothetical protein
VQQRQLICNLLSRKIDADTIRHIGPLWLLHFDNQDLTPDPERQNFRTEQSEAEALFNSCLDHTLKNRDLKFKSKPTYDYQSLIDNYRVYPTQLATIQRILQSTRQRKRQTELSSPFQEGDDSSVCKKKDGNSQWESEVPLSHDAYFIGTWLPGL